MTEPSPDVHDDVTAGTEATALQKLSWVLYDWANSGYGLIVITAVFPSYFITTLLPVLPELGLDPKGEPLHGLRLFGSAYQGITIVGFLTSLSMALMAV